MATDLMMIKNEAGVLKPADPESAELYGKLAKGKPLGLTVKQLRNGQFHRRIFSLIKFCYDNTELPEIEYKGEMVRQSFESFRKRLVILAGHHTMDVSADGKRVELRAQSLSYAQCSQELAEEIYGDLLDVVSKHFFDGQYTPERLHELTEEWMRYAA